LSWPARAAHERRCAEAAGKTAHAYIDWFSVLIRGGQSYSTGYVAAKEPECPDLAHIAVSVCCH